MRRLMFVPVTVCAALLTAAQHTPGQELKPPLPGPGKGQTNVVASVAFSPDGKTLASGSADWTIKLWDTTNGQERATLKGHANCVNSVAFSGEGKTLAADSVDLRGSRW